MIKNKILIKFISSGLQAVAVQVLGSGFFYVISVYISKNDFGIISWMSAACLLLTTFLGLGLEQVVVRRIAASRSDWAASAFLVHAVVGFLLTFLVLLTLKDQPGVYRYLPWFFVAQGLIYIGVPLKQFLNAKEQFTPYAIIAVVSNAGKIAAVYLLLNMGQLNLNTVILILIVFAGFEWCCLMIFVVAKTKFSFKTHFKAYKKLLKEASAQYVSVIFDISLSRLDWILLGLITTNVVLADYSFAYRAFELARLPMAIIGPVILPRLARLMAVNNKPDAETVQHINSFNNIELFFAVLIPLLLNILWTPLVGLITKGKYGDASATQFLILSLCIPLQLFINLLWSLSFSAKKYRSVTTITIISALTNVVLNLVLIPWLSGPGAAIAFFTATLLQGILYYRLVHKTIMTISLKPAIVFIVLAVVIYLFTIRINVHYGYQLLIGAGAYAGIAILSGQLTRQHFANFKQFLTR